MINAEIEARELQDKLTHICPEAKIDFKVPAANEAVITIHNPNGGLPVNIFSNDFDHEFKVVYFKTPRFFPSNQDGIAALPFPIMLQAKSFIWISSVPATIPIRATALYTWKNCRKQTLISWHVFASTKICSAKVSCALNCKPGPQFVSTSGIRLKISVTRCKTAKSSKSEFNVKNYQSADW